MAGCCNQGSNRHSRPDGEAALKINRKQKVFVTYVLTKGTHTRLCFNTDRLQEGIPCSPATYYPNCGATGYRGLSTNRTQATGKFPEEVTLHVSSTGAAEPRVYCASAWESCFRCTYVPQVEMVLYLQEGT